MKFFFATVELRQLVRIEVAALDEREAMEVAKAQARPANGAHAEITNVSVMLRGESEFNPGTRVVSRIFGPGTVTAIESNYGNGASLTVQFDRGDVKKIHAPHPSLLPENIATDTP